MLNHIVMFRRRADVPADADLKPYLQWAAVDYTV